MLVGMVQREAEQDGLDRVQLGHVDVDPDVLNLPGSSLRELMSSGRDWDVQVPEAVWDELPGSGWRRIRSRADTVGSGRSEQLAAPHPDVAGAWVLINLAERAGRWIVSADPGPVEVAPGRASRRRGLRLTWPTGEICACSVADITGLTIELHNELGSVWKPGPRDGGAVFAWLSEEDGTALPACPWFAHGGGGSDLTLQPAAVLVLPVTAIAVPDAEPPPGTYQLTALLTSLNLRSDITHVHIS